MSTEQLKIVGGDGRFELMAQLMDPGRVAVTPGFKLTLEHPAPTWAGAKTIDLQVRIGGIRVVPTTDIGTQWEIQGYVIAKFWDEHPWFHYLFDDHFNFTASYSTRSRKGTYRPGSFWYWV